MDEIRIANQRWFWTVDPLSYIQIATRTDQSQFLKNNINRSTELLLSLSRKDFDETSPSEQLSKYRKMSISSNEYMFAVSKLF